MSTEPIEEERRGPVAETEIASALALGRRVTLVITDAVEVRRDLLDLVLVCVVAEGHILIEDLPGVGKTTLARSVARAFDLQFARVQCTADLLPADVVGTNVFNQREDRFEFRPGPIFANVVLVDEINRASPKTQSGLLECMQERRVTVDVHTHELARPFVVLATQNPVEFEGTYPLPEAQVDRFMARVSMGYPSSSGEVAMLRAHEVSDRVEVLEPVATAAELLAVQDAARRIHASDRARRQPARGAHAAARREGARADAGPRSRASRRRPGARPGGPAASPGPCARGGRRHRRADRGRRPRGDPRVVGDRGCARPPSPRSSDSC
jgi:MoxR-like ATPase